MKRAIFLLIAISILTTACFAQENLGARPISMGGAFTGLADDVNAVFVNPAGIGYLKGESASISTKISEGRQYTIIGGVESTSVGAFGVGYITSAFDLADPTETEYLSEGGETPVRAMNQTLVLSYARQLNEFMVVPDNMGKLSLGTSVKFSSNKINTAKGLSEQSGTSGVKADVAAVFRANDSLSWGLSMKNLFSKADKTDDSQADEGFDVAMGVSGNVFDKSLTWSAEGQCIGLEYRPTSVLAVRVGRDGDYNTSGIGVNLSGVSFDYAYLAKETPVHYVGVSVAVPEYNGSDTKQASLDIQ
ncbi:MAG: hypothetical protein KKA31_00310 [Candidatus Margulisbacteria bacterium]|nr:hypothetical protein [Candidatus Margulisiibacteriota bacterium]